MLDHLEVLSTFGSRNRLGRASYELLWRTSRRSDRRLFAYHLQAFLVDYDALPLDVGDAFCMFNFAKVVQRSSLVGTKLRLAISLLINGMLDKTGAH